MESAIAGAFKAGHAARLEFPNVRLEETRGYTDPAGTSLWLESLLGASECLNRSATSANDGWISSHEEFYGSRAPLPLLPFFYSSFYSTPRQQKTKPRARMRFSLNFGYNHRRDCY